MFNTTLPDLPVSGWIGIILLITASLTLLVAGLVTIARTPERNMPGGLPKVAWSLICFIQFIGPIIFFILLARERRLAGPVQDGSDPAQSRNTAGTATENHPADTDSPADQKPGAGKHANGAPRGGTDTSIIGRLYD